MGLEAQNQEIKITKCCDVREMVKGFIDRNLAGWGEGKIYIGIEFLYKTTRKANCEECNEYYQETEQKQVELFRSRSNQQQ